MQANSLQVSSATRRILLPAARSGLFATLLWLSAAAGRIAIPGTPVPITLQTFVLMIAALTLSWREAGGAVAAYLAAGAMGLPVFSGGMSAMALIGPDAGFLLGFLPGIVLSSMLKGSADRRGMGGYLRTSARYFLASILGCVIVVYAFGFIIQSALTSAPIGAVASASMGFVIGDVIKAAIASFAAAGIAKLL
ncbi:MAG: biotin transporter BioY [Bifidobacterium sp.]|jgi:biotin transport system substrate-specific component|nr:biotin transporter BioY [Bifidobacterium sp.]MCI1864426.1 biotin transporter BioY [Bifidobacterium sp.]